MNPPPSARLRLTTVDAGDIVRIELEGDLDHGHADHLLAAVTDRLETPPRPRELRLDCGGLGHVDPIGLSILLMIRRHTDRAGVRLHLDDRSPDLERLLSLTGTADHFTGTVDDFTAVRDGGGAASDHGGEPTPTDSARPGQVRPTGPDSTT